MLDEDLERGQAEIAAKLIERLLTDPAFRGRFRRNPAAACREAGLEGLADEMSLGAGKAMMTLEVRESKSSLAGVVMAAAMEGMGVYEFTKHIAPQLDGLGDGIGDVLSHVSLPAIKDVFDGPNGASAAVTQPPAAEPDAPEAPQGASAAAPVEVPAEKAPAAEVAEAPAAEEAPEDELAPGEVPSEPPDEPQFAAVEGAEPEATAAAATEAPSADAPEFAAVEGAEPAAPAAETPAAPAAPPAEAAEPVVKSVPPDPDQYGQEGPGGPITPEVKALLDNPKVQFDEVGVQDLKEGRIDPRVVAALTKLSEEHEITVSCMCSDHAKMSASGNVSNHAYGRGVDIATIDGEIVRPGSAAARELASELSDLDPDMRPNEIGTPFAIAAPGYFSDAAHQDHIHFAFKEPIDTDWKPPEDVAATGAAGAPVAAAAAVPGAAPAAAASAPAVPGAPAAPAAGDSGSFMAVTAEAASAPGAPPPGTTDSGAFLAVPAEAAAASAPAPGVPVPAGPASEVAADPAVVPAPVADAAAATAAGGSPLGAAALQVAQGELGVQEAGTNTGVEVNKYLAAAGVPPGNPWCASFVTWALGENGHKMEGGGWGAVATWVNSAREGNNDLQIVSAEDARPGDLVAYDWGGQEDFGADGHIGFLASTVDGGKFTAVEGNWQDQVIKVPRNLGGGTNVKFLRIGEGGAPPVTPDAAGAAPQAVAAAATEAPAAPAAPAAAAAPAPTPADPTDIVPGEEPKAPTPEKSDSAVFEAVKAKASSTSPPRASAMFLKAVDPSEAKVTPDTPAPAEPAAVEPAASAASAVDPAAVSPFAADLADVGDYPGDDAGQEALAKWLAKEAEKAGLPPELPVMAALVESGVKNVNFGDADSVGFFQMRVGIWNQGDYAGYPENPKLQAKWFIDQALAVKEQRMERGLPVDDPSQFGEWIADVERPAEQYRGRYQLRLAEARKLLG